jgi:hypothetical protein
MCAVCLQRVTVAQQEAPRLLCCCCGRGRLVLVLALNQAVQLLQAVLVLLPRSLAVPHIRRQAGEQRATALRALLS